MSEKWVNLTSKSAFKLKTKEIELIWLIVLSECIDVYRK